MLTLAYKFLCKSYTAYFVIYANKQKVNIIIYSKGIRVENNITFEIRKGIAEDNTIEIHETVLTENCDAGLFTPLSITGRNTNVFTFTI
jgi:hypothetical protein